MHADITKLSNSVSSEENWQSINELLRNKKFKTTQTKEDKTIRQIEDTTITKMKNSLDEKS